MNNDNTNKQAPSMPCLITAVILLLALAPCPYGYYQLLRFVVCGAGVYIAFTAHNEQKIWAVWLFGFVALLFNPLIPIHLSREIWQPIDVICAILFIVMAFVLKKPEEDKDEEGNKEEPTGMSRLNLIENKLKDKNKTDED